MFTKIESGQSSMFAVNFIQA